MGPNPVRDVGEITFGGTCVQQIARSVTIGDGASGSIVMSLTLKHSNAIVELIYHPELLVRCCVIGIHKGAVVSSDECDVGVLPITEFGIIIASLSVGWSSRGRSRSCRG